MKKTTDRRARALLPASTRTQARVVLFQPTKRPTRRSGEWQTSADGKRRVRVTGRLGQRHADVLEAICATAIAMRSIDDGGVELIVDPYRVRRCMGAGRGRWGSYSKEQTQVLLADLCSALIEIRTPRLDAQGYHAIGHLIDHWVPAEDGVIDPRMTVDPLTGNQRSLWRVRLGVVLTELIRVDGKLWRDPEPIAALRSGASQALARHVLTHSFDPPGGWWLDTLLDAVGVAVGGQARKQARRAVRDDAKGLAVLGITVQNGRVSTAREGIQPPGRVSAATLEGVQPPGEGVQPPGEGVQPPGECSSIQYPQVLTGGPLEGRPLQIKSTDSAIPAHPMP